MFFLPALVKFGSAKVLTAMAVMQYAASAMAAMQYAASAMAAMQYAFLMAANEIVIFYTILDQFLTLFYQAQ